MLSTRKTAHFVLTLLVLVSMLFLPQSAAHAAVMRYAITTGVDAGDCTNPSAPCLTINYAVGQALAGDTILVSGGPYTGTGTGTYVVTIGKSLTLSGGWDSSFTVQTGLSTIDGQGARRVMLLSSTGSTVVLDHFDIANGYNTSSGGAGIFNNGTLTINSSLFRNNWSHVTPGAIATNGTLTINDSTFTGNSMGDPALTGGGGGAAIGTGSPQIITLNRSTLSDNYIIGDFSGAVAINWGDVRLNDSTITGSMNGPAISAAYLTVNNSTISGNEEYAIWNFWKPLSLNGVTITGNGGGIYNSYAGSTMRNSIVAGNGQDCGGSVGIISAGHNLIGDDTGCTFTATTGDLVGTGAAPIDPVLLPLAQNGGPTLTHALTSGSPAIDAGNPAQPGSGGDACLATDQRGIDRTAEADCDMGAYEVHSALVMSIARLDPSPSGAPSVRFGVHFSGPVTGVDASDFALATEGLTGAEIIDISGSAAEYTVTTGTGTYDGTMRLDLLDDDSIVDDLGLPLGGPGLGNGDFAAGELYTIDHTNPHVVSILRADPSPTNTTSFDYTITFSEPVSGVNRYGSLPDFRLDPSYSCCLGDLTGSGAIYTLTINVADNDETLRLDVTDNDSILDAAGNPLGGIGAGNGDFTDGEVYVYDRPPFVSSITRLVPDPESAITSAPTVDFIVTFTEDVTGVDVSDFALTTQFLSGVAVTAVQGSGRQFTVAANTGYGSGTIQLDLIDDDSIHDSFGSPLMGNPSYGPRTDNGDFTWGEYYVIDRTPDAISPWNEITGKRPTFTWGPVDGATRYRVQVWSGATTVYTKTLSPGVCVAGTCTHKSGKSLQLGTYTWGVQAMLNGLWQPMGFTPEFYVAP